MSSWNMGLLGAVGVTLPAFELIQTVNVTGSPSSVTFSNVNTLTQYRHLQIRYAAKSSGNFNERQMRMRMNGVTSTSYADHLLRGNGSNVASSSNLNLDYTTLGFITGSASAAANSFGAGVVDFLDAFSTSNNKTLRKLWGYHVSGAGGETGLISGLFISTSAISSIQFYVEGGQSFVAGSRFSLYGIRG